MPLSEHEQRALQAMEQALYQDDPVFAHRVRSGNASLDGRHRRTLSVFGVAVGLALMFAFCLTTAVAAGIASFLIMLVSLDTFWTNTRQVFEAILHGPANDPSRDRFRHGR